MEGLHGRATDKGSFFDLRLQFSVYILGSNSGQTRRLSIFSKICQNTPFQHAKCSKLARQKPESNEFYSKSGSGFSSAGGRLPS